MPISKPPVAFTCLTALTIIFFSVLLPRSAAAAPLNFFVNIPFRHSSPAITLLISTSSVADQLTINAGNIIVNMSASTGGTFVFTSPRAMATSTSGSGGVVSQSCTGGIETDTITQSSASEVFTFTPGGGACSALATSSPVSNAITFVQQATGSWVSGNSYTITLNTVPTLGNTLILSNAESEVTQKVSSISQVGVTWHKAVGSHAVQSVEMWYGEVGNLPSSTVNINLLNTPTAATRGNISEWRGLATSNELDASSTASSAGQSANPSTATISPSVGENVLLMATYYTRHPGTFISGPSNGFTSLSNTFAGTSQPAWQFGYKIASSTSGSYSTGWVFGSSSGYDAEIATFDGLQ